jgi:hypothetical protein
MKRHLYDFFMIKNNKPKYVFSGYMSILDHGAENIEFCNHSKSLFKKIKRYGDLFVKMNYGYVEYKQG